MQFELESKLLIISTFTVDKILKETNHPADCLALYNFYYYTAKWQETNQPKATTEYCAKGLGMSRDRVKQAKRELIKLNLIEDVTIRDAEQKITGWYIKVCYIWRETTQRDFHRVENSTTNALSVTTLNALSVTKEEKKKEKPFNEELNNELINLCMASKQLLGKSFKNIKAITPNYRFWREQYSADEILEALRKSKFSEFWRDKMTVEILLRQKDTKGNAVDRIGEFLALEEVKSAYMKAEEF